MKTVVGPNDNGIDRTDRTQEREDFARALSWLMDERGISQRELAHRLGRRSYGPFYRWFDGSTEPEPTEVFLIEKVLEVPPGALSRYLGYLPPEARSRPSDVSFEEFLRGDPALNELGRRTLLAVYGEVTRKPQRRQAKSGS